MQYRKTLSLFLIALFFIHVHVSGTVYYVSASCGNDGNSGTSENSAWQTLNKVNRTQFQPGDSILLKRGNCWQEQLYIQSSGTSSSPILVADYGTGNKPVIMGGGKNFAISLDAKDYITFRNLTIQNSDGKGLAITESQTNGIIRVQQCEIHDNFGDGISVWNRGNIEIVGCQIYRNTGNKEMDGTGISIFTSPRNSWSERKGHSVKVEKCEIYKNKKHGMYIEGDYGIVRDNKVYSNGGNRKEHNFYLIGDHALVENNSFSESNFGLGFRYEGSDLVFRYNFLRNNGFHSLGFWNDFSETMSNNKIYYNVFIVKKFATTEYPPYAISIGKDAYMGNFDGIGIYHNTIYALSDDIHAVYLSGCDNVEIKNNILYMQTGCLISRENSVSYLKSDYNVLISLKTRPFSDSYSLQEWRNLNLDQHSLSQKPFHVVSPNTPEELKLPDGSSAIDNGTTLPFTRDFAGNKIVTIPDIGAYEH